MVVGLVAAALWCCFGSTARQEGSSLSCELLMEEGNTVPYSALTSRCCVQLWASCSGNGNWSKFSRGQRPAELSRMEPGFAQWSMVGRQKTPGINLQEERFRLDRRKDTFMVGTVRQWSCCPEREAVHCTQRLARPDKTHSNLESTLLWTKED